MAEALAREEEAVKKKKERIKELDDAMELEKSTEINR